MPPALRASRKPTDPGALSDAPSRRDQVNNGRSRPGIVESHGQLHAEFRSKSATHRMVSLAKVRDGENFKYLLVPRDFYIGGCALMAGIGATLVTWQTMK